MVRRIGLLYLRVRLQEDSFAGRLAGRAVRAGRLTHPRPFYIRAAMASMNSSVPRTCGFASVVMRARSPVIWPASIVSRVARSRRSANATSSGSSSNSPRLRSAPVHAKIVATEFVDVASPARCL